MANQMNPNPEDANADPKNVESEPGNLKTKEPGDQNNRSLRIFLGAAGFLVLVCGLLVLGILYRFGRPYLEPKTQIILEPDHSRVSTVDHADLENAARILTARCRLLGCDISFAAAENNYIIGQVPESVDAPSFIGRITGIGLLELVDFGESPAATGTTIATDFDYQYFPQVEGEKWHTVMSNSDFKSADVTRDQFGSYQISFTLTSSGRKILSDYTTNNVGHYLGIVLDRVVISAPVVNAPITGGSGVIAGSFTQEEAENLAAYLSTDGPLPLPLKLR